MYKNSYGNLLREHEEFLSSIIVGIREVSFITGVPIRKIYYWIDKGIINRVNKEGRICINIDNIKKINLIKKLINEGSDLDSAAAKLDELNKKAEIFY